MWRWFDWRCHEQSTMLLDSIATTPSPSPHRGASLRLRPLANDSSPHFVFHSGEILLHRQVREHIKVMFGVDFTDMDTSLHPSDIAKVFPFEKAAVASGLLTTVLNLFPPSSPSFQVVGGLPPLLARLGFPEAPTLMLRPQTTRRGPVTAARRDLGASAPPYPV